MNYKYNHAILGGTFDHLHVGHKSFITQAFNNSNHVTIGIVKTAIAYKKSYDNSLESYESRVNSITDFLNQNNLLSRSTVIPITDIFGTTLTDKSIEAIYITDSTKPNALLINEKRKSLDMTLLEIISVPHVIGDDGEIVSSSRIRAGLIDSDGHSYLKFFESKSNYSLPNNLRESLKNPLGIVIKDLNEIKTHIPASNTLISVGDVVTMNLMDSVRSPSIAIVDFRTKRQSIDENQINKYFSQIDDTISNPSSTINSQIGKVLIRSLTNYQKTNSTQIIKVEGEEDLLAIPSIILSPLNSYIVYGIPSCGMCIVEVTPKLKNSMHTLLKSFS